MTRPVRFPLGQIAITANASLQLSTEAVFAALSRHAVGDWGNLCPEDTLANDNALDHGGRLFSAYGQGDNRFWVITEADRSVTTVLLPEDWEGSMNTPQLTSEALDAFWHVIVERFPTATTGDLSPLATFQLHQAAEAAVREWIANNVTTQETDIAEGYRFRLFRPVDRFADFLAPADLTGTLTAVDDTGVWGRMDQHIAGAEQWDNQIHWQTPEEFARDTVPI